MHSSSLPAGSRSAGWLARATIGGFVALGVSTVALVVVAGVAGAIGEVYRGSGLIFDWMYGLAHNRLVASGLGSVWASVGVHLVFGMLWAILYALLFEPRLRHFPGWQAGAMYSLLPFALSVVVFFPLTGGGLFGSELGAGPLPLIGNLILHLLYGATLGAGYGAGADVVEVAEDAGREMVGHSVTIGRAETSAARGILIGAVAGGVIGALGGALLPPSDMEQLIGSWVVALAVAGGLSGGAVGALIGSMTGLTEPMPPSSLVVGPPDQGQPIAAALIPLGVVCLVAVLIVSIGSALLTVGDTHVFGKEQGYNQAILLGLSILAVITVGAVIFSRGPRRPSNERH